MSKTIGRYMISPIGSRTTVLSGTKLEALYRWIQNKGRFLGVPGDHKFYKLKVLEYSDGDFIGFIRRDTQNRLSSRVN